MPTKTHMTTLKEKKITWYLIDAKGKVLGRLATRISRILMGKTKVKYVPYLDLGDHVVVVNAKEIAVTGTKEDNKHYYSHSGYPGGFKDVTLSEMRKKDATEIIRNAVKGMMPKTRMARSMMKKLHIFNNETHTYTTKQIELLN